MIGKLWPDSNCWCCGASCLSHTIWMRWSFTRPRASQKASAGFRSTPSQVNWHLRRHEMRWEELRWDEMKWSVECEVQVWSVECGAWRVQCEVWRKCPLGVALRRGRPQIMFLDNSTATASKKNAHALTWLVHGTRKFYRWKGPYSVTLRQLSPRLVRALLVYK